MMMIILSESFLLFMLGDTWIFIIPCINAEFAPSFNHLIEFSGSLIFSFTLNMIFFSVHVMIILNDDELEFSYENPTYGLLQPIFSATYNHYVLLLNIRMCNQDYLCSIFEFIVISSIFMILNIYNYNWKLGNAVIGGFSFLASALQLWFISTLALYAT